MTDARRSGSDPGRTVVIDGHMIGSHETGNETYVVELTRALGQLGRHDYLLYASRAAPLPPGLDGDSSIATRRVRTDPAAVRLSWRYPRLLAHDHACLAHFTYLTPLRSPCPVVVSVHDVSFRRYPEFFSPRVRLLLGLLLGRSLRRARLVITLSEQSRGDIVRFYGLAPGRIRVTPGAAADRFAPRPADEIDAVRRRYGITGRYLLAVGNVQPRKNLPRLVEAFSALAAGTTDLQLVIAGRSAWQGSATLDAVRRHGLGDRVRFAGYVPEADLPALYSGATVFCYPSLYEGFGLPALEAMACGAPTVTSDRSSLPEVVGDAAVTVDPESISAIAGALGALLADDELRTAARARGLARARSFSWEATARATADVYDQVLGGA